MGRLVSEVQGIHGATFNYGTDGYLSSLVDALGKTTTYGRDAMGAATSEVRADGATTGLVTVTVEEALRSQIPILVIDVKGDLPNLLLAFPTFDASAFRPWAAGSAAAEDTRSPQAIADELAATRQADLALWNIDEPALRTFHDNTSSV